jgi:hypothetical protein
MKNRGHWIFVVFFVLLFAGAVVLSAQSGQNIPSFLTIIIDGQGKGFSVKNADAESHTVMVDILWSDKDVISTKILVPAKDIYYWKSDYNGKALILTVTITDWI